MGDRNRDASSNTQAAEAEFLVSNSVSSVKNISSPDAGGTHRSLWQEKSFHRSVVLQLHQAQFPRQKVSRNRLRIHLFRVYIATPDLLKFSSIVTNSL